MHYFEVLATASTGQVKLLVADLPSNADSIEAFIDELRLNCRAIFDAVEALIVRPCVGRNSDYREIFSDEFAMTKLGSTPMSRATSTLWDAYQSPDVAFARMMEKPFCVLGCSDYRHYLSPNFNPNAPSSLWLEANHDKIIKQIKDAELDIIINSGHARFPELPGSSYTMPSGRATRSFLRVGNIQRSSEILDSFFFWLLPYLEGCAGILCDTWSISSIALNASRRLHEYAGGTDACAVEMLNSYHLEHDDTRLYAASCIDRIMDRSYEFVCPDNDRVLVLISATHTGGLAIATRKLLDERGTEAEKVQFLALYCLGKSSEIDALRDLSDDPGFGVLGEDALGHDDMKIPIDPQVYFPQAYVTKKLPIRAPQSKQAADFVAKYAPLEPFEVHKDVEYPDNTRHHGVWIDTLAIAETEAFRLSLEALLAKSFAPPSIIVSPPHPAAVKVAQQVLAYFVRAGHEIQRFETLRLSDPECAEAINRLEVDRSVLVVDDAFITGARIQAYVNQARGLTFNGRINYLVAVARPPSMEKWIKHRDKLWSHRSRAYPGDPGGNTVAAVDEIVLPDWRETGCPWCREYATYQGILEEGRFQFESDILDERFTRLVSASSLRTGLFLTAEERTEPVTLSKGSIFCGPGAHEATVFAAVASALQTLRAPVSAGGSGLGPRRFPIATILDDEEYLQTAFSETVLRASILRAAEPEELVYPDDAAEMARAGRLCCLVSNGENKDRELLPEALLALAQNKFPKLDRKEERIAKAVQELGLEPIVHDLFEDDDDISLIF